MSRGNQEVSVLFLLFPLAIVLLAIYIVYSHTMRQHEGFEDGSGAEVPVAAAATAATAEPTEGFEAKANPVIEGVKEAGAMASTVVGKAYDSIAAAEKDGPAGEEFHLDAGGSFLAAYKKLQPEQISSMTADARELIETQKHLMSTLATLKPLISDGKEMLKTFSDYFGSDMKTLSV